MTAAGIDAGAKCLKVVIVRDGAVLAKRSGECGLDVAGAAEEMLAEALDAAGLSRGDLSAVAVTGAGAAAVSAGTAVVTVTRALSLAASNLNPAARTVIDVGAEESRAVKLDEKGNAEDFALNDKCAAGAGSFIEAMSRALDVPLKDMGRLALTAEEAVAMNAQCVVFAESEVVSLIHRQVPPAKIARAAYESMAARVMTLLKRLGVHPEVMVVGGVARDLGFMDALSKKLGVAVSAPEDPEYACALGAALSARGT